MSWKEVVEESGSEDGAGGSVAQVGSTKLRVCSPRLAFDALPLFGECFHYTNRMLCEIRLVKRAVSKQYSFSQVASGLCSDIEILSWEPYRCCLKSKYDLTWY